MGKKDKKISIGFIVLKSDINIFSSSDIHYQIEAKIDIEEGDELLDSLVAQLRRKDE